MLIALVYLLFVNLPNAGASADYPSVPHVSEDLCPVERASCFTWKRSDNARRIVIRGTNPVGRIVLVNRNDKWVTLSATRRSPWTELAAWSTNALNSGNPRSFPHFTLWGRPAIEREFRDFLYFTELHARGEFYLSYDVEADGDPFFTSESSFPNGGFDAALVYTSDGCRSWGLVANSLPPSHSWVVEDTVRALNGDSRAIDRLRESLPGQPEYVDFVQYVAGQYPAITTCTPDEPPVMP
jgi:hypothetical protein